MRVLSLPVERLATNNESHTADNNMLFTRCLDAYVTRFDAGVLSLFDLQFICWFLLFLFASTAVSAP